MSGLEDLLRDAYQDAASAVPPASIRGLGEPAAPRVKPAGKPAERRARRRGWLAPLAAAAAVVAIVVLAAVALLPSPSPSQPRPGSVSMAEPKFLVTIPEEKLPALQVRNVATGAVVARVSLPDSQLPAGDYSDPITVATADGRHYLVAIGGSACRAWLYQFQLNERGQPSAVTVFAALPTISSELRGLTISANGQMIGYTTTGCPGAKPQPSYLAATNVRTGQTTRWTVPGTAANGAIVSVSLTANGDELCYASQQSPPVVRVIPTSAAPGSAADRGRTVARAAQFGGSEFILFAAITPDGKAVYFTTYPERFVGNWAGQVRELNLATGRSHIVYAPAGLPGAVTADPLVRHLLLQIEGKAKPSLNPPPPMLAALDLATGKVTYLPNGWLGVFLESTIRW